MEPSYQKDSLASLAKQAERAINKQIRKWPNLEYVLANIVAQYIHNVIELECNIVINHIRV